MTSAETSPPKIMPVILSGGAGTRLWPMSTDVCPKQFLALVDERTMFQMTLDRTKAPALFQSPLIIGSAAHAGLMEQQLSAIGVVPEAIILEPVARNTAPAVALAALAAGGGDTPILVMPSDHVITDVDAFLAAVMASLPAAQQGWLVTFGIEPNAPETGYGYISMSTDPVAESPACKATRFIEKPDRTKALEMLEKGGHVWNAGIFLFRADAYLTAMAQLAPEMLASVKASFDSAARQDLLITPENAAFAKAESNSIDYAIMEKAPNVAVMPVSCGWSDVGSWDALADIIGANEQGCQLVGDVIAIESENTVVRADGIRVSLYGVRDLVVIANGKEVMIVPRGNTQMVKKIVEAIKAAAL